MKAFIDQRMNAGLLEERRPGTQLLTAQQWQDVGEFLNISQRERQVCQLLFEGQTRQAIADALGIKNRTVRHHMEQLHAKLKVGERVGVVLRIVQIRDEIGRRSQRDASMPAIDCQQAIATVASVGD